MDTRKEHGNMLGFTVTFHASKSYTPSLSPCVENSTVAPLFTVIPCIPAMVWTSYFSVPDLILMSYSCRPGVSWTVLARYLVWPFHKKGAERVDRAKTQKTRNTKVIAVLSLLMFLRWVVVLPIHDEHACRDGKSLWQCTGSQSKG